MGDQCIHDNTARTGSPYKFVSCMEVLREAQYIQLLPKGKFICKLLLVSCAVQML